MRTKLEVTQEEIFTSSDEQDAQRREEEEGGELLTLSPEMLKIDVEPEIDCNSKMEGSPDWSVKGNRRRGSSTMSTSNGVQFDELKNMILSLARCQRCVLAFITTLSEDFGCASWAARATFLVIEVRGA